MSNPEKFRIRSSTKKKTETETEQSTTKNRAVSECIGLYRPMYPIQAATDRESADTAVKFILADVPGSIRIGPFIFRYEPAGTERTGRYLEPPSPCSLYAGDAKHEDHWTIMDGEDDDTYTITTSSTSSFEDPTVSNVSSSSDMAEDASSSSTSNLSSSSCSTEPLYDLSELMVQLPIKRGLSKFYKGKSQSFASLSMVTSIEDLPKKETPFRRKLMKASNSYGGGLDSYKSYTLPKPTISKKASRGSSSSLSLLSFPTRRGSFVSSCSSPLNPVQENWGC